MLADRAPQIPDALCINTYAMDGGRRVATLIRNPKTLSRGVDCGLCKVPVLFHHWVRVPYVLDPHNHIVSITMGEKITHCSLFDGHS